MQSNTAKQSKDYLQIPRSAKNLQDELEKVSDLALEAALASEDYSFYIEFVHEGNYRHAPHTLYISDYLNRIERGEFSHDGEQHGFIFTLPPQHSKSNTITETFPSYYIGRQPWRRVIVASYGDDLAEKFGSANLDKIERFGPLVFSVSIDPRENAKKKWKIKGKRGGMLCRGITAGITGNPADLVIIDDPFKTWQDADSQTYRDLVWNEWQTAISRRLAPGGIFIIIATRWHEDDLIGRLLKQQNDLEKAGEACVKWHLVNLPAIAEENDPLGRAPGDPLWPERGYNQKWYQITKNTLALRHWLALYQQRPTAVKGNIIDRDWWKYYDVLPARFDEIIQSWDMSFKGKKQTKKGDPDYVVGQVWGRVGPNYYLIDQVRAQMGFVATKIAFRALTNKYNRNPLNARKKIIEAKANGPAIEDEMRHEIPGIVLWDPKGESKITRLEAVAPFVQSGNVFLPNPSGYRLEPGGNLIPGLWVNEFVEEVAAFPNGKNDDMVDAFDQAILNMAKRGHSLIGALQAQRQG